MKAIVRFACPVLLVSFVWTVFLLAARPRHEDLPPPGSATPHPDRDQELAYLLVKLVLRTRATIASHFTRSQSVAPGVDLVYRRWLTRNRILPAAVAGDVFHDLVPAATRDRAWVRMVVEEPRNPKNRGDDQALTLLRELRGGAPAADAHAAGGAYYYAEPIKAVGWCLACHGDPRGDPDPAFPEYRKNGWKVGEVIGAVVARVAPWPPPGPGPGAGSPDGARPGSAPSR